MLMTVFLPWVMLINVYMCVPIYVRCTVEMTNPPVSSWKYCFVIYKRSRLKRRAQESPV